MSLFASSVQHLKTTLGRLLFASIAVGFLCVSLVHAIPDAHASMDGQHAAHTESMATASCCGGDSDEHMELWKGTFVGVTQHLYNLALVFLIVLAAYCFADLCAVLRWRDVIFVRLYRTYAREHPNVHLYNPLCLAFARGILHPKTF